MGIEDNQTPDSHISNWLSGLPYGQWQALPVSGPRPPARYKHTAAVVDGKLYAVGGSRNGRHLSDIQVLNLKTLTWSALKLHAPEPNSLVQKLPAISGHSMVKWENKLFLLGGDSKESSDFVTVRSINLETYHCNVVKTSGKLPISRAGQSVTLFGNKLVMFGGEHTSRQLLNDIHILDLETMTWDVFQTMHSPPAPRFDHTAAVHADRYLLIFGGCSHSTCFNDLHILDLQTKEWSQPQQIQGDVVTPRAGHAGISMDGNWYIVGGGDNQSGASDTLVLNMSKLVWSVLTNVKERDPLASEGLSVCSTSLDGEKLLIAFGGYYGKYNNEVYVLKPKPIDSSRPKIFQSPAAAAAAASVTAAYSLNSKGEKRSASVTAAYSLNSKGEKRLDSSKSESESLEKVQNEPSPNGSESLEKVQNEPSPNGSKSDINAATAEKEALEFSLSEVRAENLRLNGLLSEMNSTHDELSKELLSVRAQLQAETSRCLKLEIQILELQKSLEALQSIEDEVKVLRKERAVLEREMDFGTAGASHKQGSGGVWQWFAGATPN